MLAARIAGGQRHSRLVPPGHPTAYLDKSGAGFQVRWVYSDGSTVFGAGLMEGDTLSIGTVEDRKSIVSLMKRQADGGFKGVWYQRGEAALGDETWIKQ